MSKKMSYPSVSIKPTNSSKRFRAWVRRFGISRLGRALNVSRITVHSWAAKKRWPRVSSARKIIALSMVEPADGRPLTYEDIYGRVEVKNEQ